MNSTRKGDLLEENIYNLFHEEIEADRFWAKKPNCKLFRKKGYFSKDRSGNIFFDFSIEIYLPGASEYSLVVLIECKNYNHAVPVDDAEEFFSKIQQISGANVKGVIASTASFQLGTRNFSKSKGIGLLRYFDKTNFKWELMRSPSTSNRMMSAKTEDTDLTCNVVEDGLSRQDFKSTVFDFYFQSPVRDTNYLWDFFEDLTLSTSLSSTQIRKIANPRSKLSNHVPFLEKEKLEAQSVSTLSEINHVNGEVSLDALCAREQTRCGLKIITNLIAPEDSPYNQALGRIVFQTLEIHIFKQQDPHRGRERFTLAHELAHHLLNHSKYMSREYCDESDHTLNRQNGNINTDIARMEFQANYLAGCLLMPKIDFINDFHQISRTLNISNKGFGALYVDNQSCNRLNYAMVTSHLMQKYGVSRSAVAIRLEGFNLLIDARAKYGAAPIQEVLASINSDYEYREI